MINTSRKEYMREYNRQYRLRNRERLDAYHKEWVAANKENLNAYKRNWVDDNRDKMTVYWREYRKKEYASDPMYSLKKRIRNLIGLSITNRGYTKKSKTYSILGCDFDQFMNHIEQGFIDGMNWDNRDQWHIDHIVPLATAQSEEDVIRLNHYTNLRPLWAIDNLRKGSRHG